MTPRAKPKKSLTPTELFDHRLAALLGRTVEEVKAIPQSAYRRWQLYWQVEPWGSYRDNLHAALIAGQVKALRMKKGSRLSIDEFMLVDRRARARENRAGFVALLRLMGRPRDEVKRARKGKAGLKARGRAR